MRKSNEYKKHFSCDKFGWEFFPFGSSRRLRRFDKKSSVRKVRRDLKEEMNKIMEEENVEYENK